MPLLDTDGEIRTVLARARTIAVVGLSESPGRDSNSVARYLLDAGYEIVPVNLRIPAALGIPSAPDLDSLAGRRIDIVDVFRRPDEVAPVVEAAIRIGAGALWFQFGTAAGDAVRRALQAGMTVVADHCIMVEHARLLGRP
jgi:predicted CoA-binding protein